MAIFAVGLPFWGSGVLVTPVEFVNIGLVIRSVGVETLGELRASLAVIGLVQFLPQALAGPMVSHLAGREGQAAGSSGATALSHMRALWAISLLGAVGLGAVWPVLVEFIFGTDYVLAQTQGQLALIPFIPTLIGTALTSALVAGGRSLPLLWVGVVQATAQLTLAWVLIPYIGLAGFFAAQAFSAATAVVLWLIALGWQRKQPPFRPWMAPLFTVTLVLCALLIGDTFIEETLIQRLIAAATAGLLTIVVILFGAMTKSERQELVATTVRVRDSIISSSFIRKFRP